MIGKRVRLGLEICGQGTGQGCIGPPAAPAVVWVVSDQGLEGRRECWRTWSTLELECIFAVVGRGYRKAKKSSETISSLFPTPISNCIRFGHLGNCSTRLTPHVHALLTPFCRFFSWVCCCCCGSRRSGHGQKKGVKGWCWAQGAHKSIQTAIATSNLRLLLGHSTTVWKVGALLFLCFFIPPLFSTSTLPHFTLFTRIILH